LPDQRLLNRYARLLTPGVASLDRLAQAIHALHHSGGAGDPFFLSKSLELLVEHLGADLATLVMVSGGEAETRWWHPEREDEEPPPAIPSFCQWLLEHPERILAIRDMAQGPHVEHLAAGPAPAHGAALGCTLRQGESVKALLFVFFHGTRAFPRAEFALLEAVAGFIGRVIEIEDLKQSLNRLEDALAITRAVMEDSSIRDAETDLPNLRYLEIWQKAMLGSSNRPKSLVVAECLVKVQDRKDVGRIIKATEGVRAGDLVVRVAPGRFQIIFQHTPRSIAHILLLRLRAQLGSAPMGATLWIPGDEGQGLESCQPRLDAALAESRAMGQPALVWQLPEGTPEEFLPKPSRSSPAPPQRWEPPTLQSPSGGFHIIKAGGRGASARSSSRPGKPVKPAELKDE
jgi:GAF domain